MAARFTMLHTERVSQLVLVDAGGVRWPGDSSLPLVFRIAKLPVLSELMKHITPRAVFAANLRGALGRDEVITDAMINRYYNLAQVSQSPLLAPVVLSGA